MTFLNQICVNKQYVYNFKGEEILCFVGKFQRNPINLLLLCFYNIVRGIVVEYQQKKIEQKWSNDTQKQHPLYGLSTKLSCSSKSQI